MVGEAEGVADSDPASQSSTAAKLELRLAGIEAQLAALREVPQQLGSVLEALAILQTRFSEQVPIPAPAPAGTVASLLRSEPGVPTLTIEVPTVGPRPWTRTLRPPVPEACPCTRTGTQSSSTTSSPSERQRGMLPLIGLPAPGELVGPLGAAEAALPRHRRPSTMSDDPSDMQIYRQRRVSTQSLASHVSARSVRSADSVAGPLRSWATAGLGTAGAVAAQQRRASTCSNISVTTLAKQRRASTASDASGQLVFFDTAVPNIVPSHREEAEAETEDADAVVLVASHDAEQPLGSTVAVLEGEPEVPDSLDPRSRTEDHRESILSLGGVSRPSVNYFGSMGLLEFDDKNHDSLGWILHPGACVRLSWDLFMVLLTLLVSIIVPVALIYLEDNALVSGICAAVLHFSSGAWFIDILLNFRTGFLQGGKVVRSPRLIAMRYMRTWLMPDLLAAFPLVLVSGPTVRIFCVLKLMRLLRLGPLLAGRQKEPHLLSLPARMGITVLIITNTTTCLWRVALQVDIVGGADAGRAASETLAAWWELYVADVYWVMMTMSTVGFGDIAPTGTGSRLFAIVAMLVAPLFFGTIVSLLTHITQSIFNDELEVQVAEAARFMRQRHLPLELQRRVEHNLRSQIRQERLTLAPAIFAKLSTAVQREVSLELLRSSVLNFPLFRGVLHSFIAELAQAHTWVQCLPGDLIVEEGQLLQEVVFVIRGRLLMQRGPDTPEEEGPHGRSGGQAPVGGHTGATEEVELSAGAWFGEAALFFDDRVRTVTVFAAAESELAVLRSCDYHRIVQKYPRLLRRHQSIEQALRAGSLSLRDVAYAVPSEPSCEEHWRFRMVPSLSSARLRSD